MNTKRALACAVEAAQQVGELMRRNLRETKTINEQSQFDIKLQLDVRSQQLITKKLLGAFPEISILGEEGISGKQDSEWRWVVDPIDGTVNFTYGIPHACVSIALQQKKGKDYVSVAGVVYDPFTDELWTAILGETSKLNGKPICVSKRAELGQAIIAIGFAKQRESLMENLPVFNNLVRQVRKMRIMGAAALSLVWVAAGRFDAYVESGVKLWDVAAGALIIECAGGEFY
ncbi:MAG: inositol monophosphatase family protein, partial [Limisphaerales bacterium]